ncbi:hypothetical protein ScPMuIL_018423 [Solemya velum]
MSKTQAEQYKEQGNECVKGGNFAEAVVHYSHAIKLDSHNHLLYSNRSLAFLKMEQYYLAINDARETIRIQPSWPKGYFRKGEVEYNAGAYREALMSYRQALLLDPSDSCIREALTRTIKELEKLRKAESREPLLFTSGGVCLGVVIVLADYFLTKEPSIRHIGLQILLIAVFGGFGFLLYKAYAFLQDTHKSSLLEKPLDLYQVPDKMNGDHQKGGEVREEQPSERKPHRKGGTSAARQRYRKGKS